MVTADEIEAAYRAAISRLDRTQRWAVQQLVEASAMIQFGDSVVQRRLRQCFAAEAARLNASAALAQRD